MDNKIYDVVILGAGPAGLAAGLYAGRSRLSVLILEKGIDGGQIAVTHDIENYPGQSKVDGMTGQELVAPMTEQCKKFGCERVSDTITACDFSGPVKKFVGSKGEYLGKTVIVCTGAMTRSIGCKNEAKYVGKGISYCAVCDANFFEDFEIYVVGGNGIAAEESLYLAGYARKVTMIHKGPALTVSPMLKERLDAEPKIHVLCNEEVEDVGGDELLSEIVLRTPRPARRRCFTPMRRTASSACSASPAKRPPGCSTAFWTWRAATSRPTSVCAPTSPACLPPATCG